MVVVLDGKSREFYREGGLRKRVKEEENRKVNVGFNI